MENQINFSRNPYGNVYGEDLLNSGDYLAMYTEWCGDLPIGSLERKRCLCEAVKKAKNSVKTKWCK